MQRTWQITVGNFCAGLVSEDGIVVWAASILKWTIGRKIHVVRKWVNSKKGLMTLSPLDKVQRNGDNTV